MLLLLFYIGSQLFDHILFWWCGATFDLQLFLIFSCVCVCGCVFLPQTNNNNKMKLLTRTKSLTFFSRCLSTDFKLLRNLLHMFFVIHILFIYFVFFNISCIDSFNLDTRIPIFKFGPKDSYFGFSVAEHITVNGHASQQEPV